MNRGRMMNEHEAHERDMQWDDAGDGAGETWEEMLAIQEAELDRRAGLT